MQSRLSLEIATLVTLGLVAGGPAAAADRVSDAATRTDVGLTIYNNDLSLVRESRRIEVQKGTFNLRFEDVTAGIDPATVQLHTRGSNRLRIIEQNYAFDLISQAKLMEKYVGREVGYRTKDGTIGKAVLLSTNQGYVYRLGSQITFSLPGPIVLDAIPQELSPRPTLMWMLDSPAAGTRDVDVAYLSTGFDWRADYVLFLDENETQGDLTAWVTIHNTSGTAFENARVQLVAGDVHRVRPAMARRVRSAAMALEEAPVSEEKLFEYHLYTLERRTDLANNQQKQVLFFDAAGVRTTKRYTYRGQPQYFSRGFQPAAGSDRVAVTLGIRNDAANHLGRPIPQGVLRVYKRDSRGMAQFLGENRVRHTPRDETLEFEVGSAFDIVGERRQTDYRRIGDRVFEVAFEIKLRNHKDEKVDVQVVEPMQGDWTILQSSLPHHKKDAFTATFDVEVPANGETVLTYRVRIQR